MPDAFHCFADDYAILLPVVALDLARSFALLQGWAASPWDAGELAIARLNERSSLTYGATDRPPRHLYVEKFLCLNLQAHAPPLL